MLFEHSRAEADGDLHAVIVIGPLMSRIPNFDLRIAFFHELNLVQLQVFVPRRIFAYAVHEGKRPVAVTEETNHLIDILKRQPATEPITGKVDCATRSSSGQSFK